jgi:hypothetical protein
MSFFSKKANVAEQSAVDRRIEKMSTEELISWADQAIFGVGRSMSDWQRFDSIESLKEARMGAEALYKVLDRVLVRLGE